MGFELTKAVLNWSPDFDRRTDKMFSNKQKFVDSEVLRLNAPLVPFRTGELMRSGTRGTVIGSGEVEYNVPYARKQYYDTATTRSYDSNRGGKWFERMKVKHKDDILRGLKKVR